MIIEKKINQIFDGLILNTYTFNNFAESQHMEIIDKHTSNILMILQIFPLISFGSKKSIIQVKKKHPSTTCSLFNQL